MAVGELDADEYMNHKYMKVSEGDFQLLLKRSFDGDKAAYDEFLTQLGEILRSYIRRQLYRVGRTECDADDLVQEALVAIHARWHTYDCAMPVTAWARAIARYKLIDFLRLRNGADRDLPLNEIEDVFSGDSEAVDAAISVKKLLSGLPAKMRISIELIRINGLSIKEAASATGMSESAIKINVHRGVKAISKLCGKI